MASPGTLAVFPTLAAIPRPDGRVVLTRKFVSGSELFAKYWGGELVNFMEPRAELTDNLDNVELRIEDLPFRLELLPFDAPDLAEKLAGCDVAFGGVSHRLNHLGRLGQQIGVPIVYGSEYTLRTRIQIVRSEVASPLRHMRRIAWQIDQERRQRAGIRRAAGIQCNGTPIFEAYKHLTPHPHLFFDTRVRRDMLADEKELKGKLFDLREGRPLRLAFSGRLNRMKGAGDLVEVAHALVRRGVRFELAILGAGELEGSMRREIDRRGLAERVKLLGVLDFEDELVPHFKQNVDLFVCPHRQGDPSCTYLETFACGVPIVGYANEALSGILERVDAGRCVRLGDREALAEAIADLDRDRAPLERWAHAALRFASQHTFEATFAGRVDHLRRVIDATASGAGCSVARPR